MARTSSRRWQGLATTCLLLTAGSTAGAQAADGVAALRWMAGCWELRTPTRITHEQWMMPLASQMMGMSRTVTRDTVRETEMLRIELRGGVPTYVAIPSGQKEAHFASIVLTDSMAVFANPAHDFPQRITYRRVGADSLVARIEGPQGGQTRGINFPMRRVSCTG